MEGTMEGASMEQPGWAGGMSLPAEAGCDPQFQEQTGQSAGAAGAAPTTQEAQSWKTERLTQSAKCNPKRQAAPAT